MRIRSIKPEFWRSDDITDLDWEARLIFIGLWSYVDDNGVGVDKLSAIAADLFAGDLEREAEDDSRHPRETFARVSRGLQTLSEAGRITRYEAGGKKFLAITNWSKHQRIDKPNKARYPEPPSAPALTSISGDSREGVASVSRGSREGPATGTGEQGNRGTEEQTLIPPPPVSSGASDGFAEFYLAYPRKVGKDAARKAWARAVRRAPSALIIAAARKFAADPNLPADKQFIPHPSTWLNAGRWEDEPLPPRAGEQQPPRPPIEGQEWMGR